MIRKIADLAREVRIALDQNDTVEALTADLDPDTLTLDQVIESVLPEAVRRVHMEAPAHLLESGHHFGECLYWGDQESGWVMLPDDFMRLVSFRMSDWSRSVTEALPISHPNYILQRQPIKALRGTARRPACFIALRPQGRVLEFYSCKSDRAAVAEALYLPQPRVDHGGGIDICPRLERAIVYMAAYLACTALGEEQRGVSMLELSKTAYA